MTAAQDVQKQAQEKLEGKFEAVCDLIRGLKRDLKGSDVRVRLDQNRTNTHIEVFEKKLLGLEANNAEKNTLAKLEAFGRIIKQQE
jgi:hypothetical protein